MFLELHPPCPKPTPSIILVLSSPAHRTYDSSESRTAFRTTAVGSSFATEKTRKRPNLTDIYDEILALKEREDATILAHCYSELMPYQTEVQIQAASDRYLALVAEVPLRPIRSEFELDRAIAMIDRLTDRGELAPDEFDYRLVLGDLVTAYEKESDPETETSQSDILRFLIESKGVAQAKVALDTGIAESTVSEILAGKRKISQNVMNRLAAYFRVEPAVFL
jgi:HTH-type transcriptional regulator/antitoxin HigA